jgi:glucosamine-6-phosphate deaminase
VYNRHVQHGKARVQIYPSPVGMGEAAAGHAAEVIQRAIGKRGRARIVVATGNSQIEFIQALASRSDVDWKNVEVFHLDEYVNIPASHPSSFRHWIQTRLIDKVHPARVEFLTGDAPDLDAELERYAAALSEAPNDLGFVGFGENGHIAFNDPPVADFNDPLVVKRVVLDEACRRQQAGEGHFKDIDSVPREAATVTCSGLLKIKCWICCVPDTRKAEAVRNALEGPVTTACPASIVREHPDATVYLDENSAALLQRSPLQKLR